MGFGAKNQILAIRGPLRRIHRIVGFKKSRYVFQATLFDGQNTLGPNTPRSKFLLSHTIRRSLKVSSDLISEESTVLQTCLWRPISYGVWGLKSDFGDQGPFSHSPSNSKVQKGTVCILSHTIRRSLNVSSDPIFGKSKVLQICLRRAISY